jgi:hypothetical protein
MATPTIKNLDKIRLLDQMLEDIAGEEFDEYGEAEGSTSADVKRFADEDLDMIDITH